MKAIVMPDHETVKNAIQSVCDVEGMEMYATLVADWMAGSTKNGYGIILGLGLRANDLVRKFEYSPIIENILWMQFPDFLEALTDDKDVIADGMKLYNETMGIEQ